MRSDERPIGVFDSGLGGLSVLLELEEMLPAENYIYFGDTARAPYGDRSADEVCRFAVEIGDWLLERHCKVLVFACHTATVLGMAALTALTSMPVFGMVEPAMAEALDDGEDPVGKSAEASGTAHDIWPVGMIATQGTVDSGDYQSVFAAKAPGKPFYMSACPAFVPFVEKGVLSGREVDQAVEQYLRPLRDLGIRTLILGCTHYPFLAPVITGFLGAGVRLANPAHKLALMVGDYLRTHTMLNGSNEGKRGEREFWCSGDTSEFKAISSHFLSRPLDEVRRQVF